ncbi:putative cytoskeleton organization protein [Phaeomoniella chlamydospora]|uniref:Putative cytoskeleton organization protein n=1 Tax=Phaeomoniella chlamydospora TaxID=158046 RepID=A0A0G2F426_PHACM|nr:putative cytoskeleton organization protein [Phaeomoniella chlamydospora]
MSSTTQRRLKPIQDHIDGGNWKQALQLCEKYQKKGEKSDLFLATRALVLAKQPEEKQQKQGKDALLQLCAQTPPITDEEIIEQLDSALTSLGLHKENSLRLWERAALAKTRDGEFIERWLARAVTELDWTSAQRAAMILRKQFPNERMYEFWVIFMCYQIQKDESIESRTRTLFGTMAYKMLAKAASETPIATDQKADIGPETQDETGDDISFQSNSYTENSNVWSFLITATIKSNEIESITRLQSLIERYRKVHPLQRHSAVANLTLLRERSRLGHNVHDALLEACKDFFASNCERPTCIGDLRNTLCCLDSERIGAFKVYAHQFTVERLNETRSFSQAALLKSNCQQLLYAFTVPPFPHGLLLHNVAVEVLTASKHWIQDGQELYAQVSDLITAIASISRLSLPCKDQGQDFSTFYAVYLIWALLIARFADTPSSPNYELQLLVVRLSGFLGMSVISLKTAQELSIKNIQWHTFAHTILTRISTLHPHNVYGNQRNVSCLSPEHALISASLLYQRAEDCETNAIMMGLKNQSYINADKAIQLSKDLQESITRKIYYIEFQRIRRLTGTCHSFKQWPDNSSDTRSSSFFPNREAPGQMSTDERLRNGPLPKDSWVRSMLTCDRCYQILTEGPNSSNLADESALSKLFAYFFSEELRVQDLPEDMTKIEKFACMLQINLGYLALTLVAPKKGYTLSCTDQSLNGIVLSLENLYEASSKAVISGLGELVESETNGAINYGVISFGPAEEKEKGSIIRGPSWYYYHYAYCILDSLRFVNQFFGFVDAVQKLPSSSVKGKAASSNNKKLTLEPHKRQIMKIMATKIQDCIHTRAKEMRMRLARQGSLGEMVDWIMKDLSSVQTKVRAESPIPDTDSTDQDDQKTEHEIDDLSIPKIIEEIMGLGGKEGNGNGLAEAEVLVAEMKESWEEGLERLISVKIF